MAPLAAEQPAVQLIAYPRLDIGVVCGGAGANNGGGTDSASGGGTGPASGGDDCAVCLHALRGASVWTTPCAHSFHVACLAAWLDTRAACPLCEAPVERLGAATTGRAKGGGGTASVGAKGAPIAVEPAVGAASSGRASTDDAGIDADHPLLAQDVSLDQLRARGHSLADIERHALSWRDALRLGLRREHFDSRWLSPSLLASLRGATWPRVRAELGYELADALTEPALTAHVLAALGESVASLRASRELTHDLFCALPFTLDAWRALALTRADLDALLLTQSEYAYFFAHPELGWSAERMQRYVGFSRDELRALGLVRSYEGIVIKL